MSTTKHTATSPAAVAPSPLLWKDQGHPSGDVEWLDSSPLAESAQHPSVVSHVDKIFTAAVKAGASDVHVESLESELLVRFRVDGTLVDAIRLPQHLKAPVIGRIKLIGRLDIDDRRAPQNGHARVRIEGRGVDLRVATLPTQFGEKVAVRILSSSANLMALDQLSISPWSLEAFQRLLRHPQGLILVTGPTGSGQTTTLYAALNYLKSTAKNIVAVEDPIEFQLPGVAQVQVEPQLGITFAAGLRSVLHQDPNIIMVGDIADAETAQAAVAAAQTGHLVLAGIHTNDAATAITRLLDLHAEPNQLTSLLVGVLAQRLVRRVCQACGTYQEPPPSAVEDLGLDKGMYDGCTWLTGQGCPECRGTGYKGRLAIHELLKVNDEIRNLIIDRAADHVIRDAAIRLGMVTLLDDGVAMAAEGLTTLEEVLRVVPCFHTTEIDDLIALPLTGPRRLDATGPTAAAPLLRTAGTAAPGKAILVIEDESDTQALLRLILEQDGYTVTTAGDGIDALLALGRNRFDLILSDINMPNMNGIALLEAKVQKGIDTPTIFLSADSRTEREQQCLELGAVDYISKPIKKDILLLRLRRALP